MGTSDTACSRQFVSSSISGFAAGPVTALWAAAPVGWNCSGTLWCPAAALHSWPSGTE